MYHISSKIIQEFLNIATNNKSKFNRHLVETLAFLVGHEDDGTLIGSHLIFPKQTGGSTFVDDEGKESSILIHEFDIFGGAFGGSY